MSRQSYQKIEQRPESVPFPVLKEVLEGLGLGDEEFAELSLLAFLEFGRRGHSVGVENPSRVQASKPADEIRYNVFEFIDKRGLEGSLSLRGLRENDNLSG